MKRGWPLATLLLLAAVVLHAAFVFYGTNTITTHRNGTVSQTIVAQPLLGEVSDMRMLPCSVREEPAASCPDSSIATLQGAFPRWSFPWAVALVGGFLVPFIFLCAVGYFAIWGITGWPRIAAGLGLIAAAVLAALAAFVVAAGSGLALLLTWNDRVLSALDELVNGETLTLGGAIALACLMGGILLLVRAWRGRKRA
ncbi:MAG TPA: hypothetical protein VH000_09615 [Rhizomicrobium sp.]|jgi:hypothetical protein|nr:hypothetical protein [Rhizomicrobium sp.]